MFGRPPEQKTVQGVPSNHGRATAFPSIPPRFTQPINAHLLGNLLDIRDYPVIMWIVGRPGMGKTWQLRRHLELLGFEILSVSAANLESELSSRPAKLIEQRYIEAGNLIAKGKPASLVIDDIDTTGGEWEMHTGTVNHQGILAVLMHLADHPTSIDPIGTVRRVPIFFTGNDGSRLYAPLTRHGRTIMFPWSPSRDEKVEIVASFLGSPELAAVETIVDKYPDQPISFFSQLAVSSAVDHVSSMSSTNASFSALLRNDGRYADQLRQQITSARSQADWLAEAERLASSRHWTLNTEETGN